MFAFITSDHVQYVERVRLHDLDRSNTSKTPLAPASSISFPVISHCLLPQVHPLLRSLVTYPSVLLEARDHHVFPKWETSIFFRLDIVHVTWSISFFPRTSSKNTNRIFHSYLFPWYRNHERDFSWSVFITIRSVIFCIANHRRRPHVNYYPLLRNNLTICFIRFLRESVAINI